MPSITFFLNKNLLLSTKKKKLQKRLTEDHIAAISDNKTLSIVAGIMLKSK